MTAKLGHLQSRAKISVGSLGTASISVQAALDFLQILARYYTKVYGFTSTQHVILNQTIRVSNMVERFAAIQLGDKIFGSRVSRGDLSFYVIISCIDEIRRAGEIIRSVYHWPAQETNSDQTNSSSTEYCLAFVDWFDLCNDHDHFHIYNHETSTRRVDNGGRAHGGMFCVELWANTFQTRTEECIVPVHRIFYQFLKGKYVLHRAERHIVVVPINRKFTI
ncbi:318_t:CDS:2 [Ambispora leptoticha]|uniref:318_t:CDS:1 n=1 Tax=Ambispora leptoticha TaxID=144679 RepID=A0A9N9CR29_9GLOM|nr:318_t:CDS:2 [Ambispora leptoticha]